MKFRELNVGDTFDWIKPNSMFNSFYLRCRKTSTRSYTDEKGTLHKVGTVNASVYHVEREVMSHGN